LSLPYSRRLEEEADEVGLQLMAKVRTVAFARVYFIILLYNGKRN